MRGSTANTIYDHFMPVLGQSVCARTLRKHPQSRWEDVHIYSLVMILPKHKPSNTVIQVSGLKLGVMCYSVSRASLMSCSDWLSALWHTDIGIGREKGDGEVFKSFDLLLSLSLHRVVLLYLCANKIHKNHIYLYISFDIVCLCFRHLIFIHTPLQLMS